jgi:hypothetical protein
MQKDQPMETTTEASPDFYPKLEQVEVRVAATCRRQAKKWRRISGCS